MMVNLWHWITIVLQPLGSLGLTWSRPIPMLGGTMLIRPLGVAGGATRSLERRRSRLSACAYGHAFFDDCEAGGWYRMI